LADLCVQISVGSSDHLRQFRKTLLKLNTLIIVKSVEGTEIVYLLMRAMPEYIDNTIT